jgi:hypothetical protein
MMLVVPVGGCACDVLAWRYQGQLRLTAIVKASFALPADGEMQLCQPEPIHPLDLAPATGPAGSIVAAADRAPHRGRADVVLVGHARALAGKPTRSRQVRLIVHCGDETLVHKSLEVVGDDSQPGGKLERVAGFGPIAAQSGVRQALLDPASRQGLQEEILTVAESMNWAYFQAAPADQQTRLLTGGETIVLEGLHPGAEHVSATLPNVRAAAALYGPAQGNEWARINIELLADMLHIDADRQLCSLTWRGSVAIPHEIELAQLTLAGGIALHGEAVALPDSTPSPPPIPSGRAGSEPERASLARGAAEDGLAGTVALSPAGNVPRAALPFSPRSKPSGLDRPGLPAAAEPAAGARGRGSPWLAGGAKGAKAATPAPEPAHPAAEGARDVDPLLGLPRKTSQRATDDGLTGTVGLSASRNVPGIALPFAARAKPSGAAPSPPAAAEPAAGAPGRASPWVAGVAGAAGTASTASTASTAEGARPETESSLPAAQPAASPALPISAPSVAAPLKAMPARGAPAVAVEPAVKPALQLLWLDLTCLGRLPAHQEYAALLDAAANRAPDPAIDSYARSSASGNADGYRDVLCVLTEARPRAASELQSDIDQAIGDGNKLIPPLVVLAGELSVAFDERRQLGATADVGAVTCPDDENVCQAVAAARAYLKAAAGGSPRVTTTLAQRILDAVVAAQDETDALELQHEIDRMLITGRSYRCRSLFGGTYLAATLRLPGTARPIAAYLREPAASQLPMFERFAVRLLAEIHLAQEEDQAAPLALRVVAVARVLSRAQPG